MSRSHRAGISRFLFFFLPLTDVTLSFRQGDEVTREKWRERERGGGKDEKWVAQSMAGNDLKREKI